ncbi:lysophospholipid acyltransferase family protein [Streptomyces sp. NPDC102274]|uniref:lysophospholipid acyltransferase family protein n=1 Tax=Streptomyces sp. NPDC102274 TaxID=3366151 RepID=UPI003806952C
MGPKVGFWYRFAVMLGKPPVILLFQRDWRGASNIPADGGFIAAVNHNSYLDPLAYGQFQYKARRPPRFLAKESLFTGPVGRLLRATGQIPVSRSGADAMTALRAAVEAVERGDGVVFYPEGTLTRDPGMWPMSGRTGTARVALMTKCPVIPVAQWGANVLLPPYGKMGRIFPRTRHTVLAGPPVDLSRFYDREMTPEVLREATEEIMKAITGLLAEIRGETAPPTPRDRNKRVAESAAAASHD